MSEVLHRVSEDRVGFRCPGCKAVHHLWVPPHPKAWEFNGDMTRPTFKPSILVAMDAPAGRDANGVERPAEQLSRCHSYVTNGLIQFLSDCSHWAAGQTIPLTPWHST